MKLVVFSISITYLVIYVTTVDCLSLVDKKPMNNEFLRRKILPDIDSQNERQLDATQFLNLVGNLNLDGFKKVSDIPFMVIIPKMNFDISSIEKKELNEFILEHIIPGVQMKALSEDSYFINSNQNHVHMQKKSPGVWTLNDVKVLKFDSISMKLITLIEIDGYLGDLKTNFTKRNIQENPNRYNEPQRLESKSSTKSDALNKEGKTHHLMNFLMGMKTGTKVFQHFLTKSNLSQIMEDTTYTVLIPSDNAFQRWHPIDWGFYPFSVQEFTENILRNHFVPSKQPIKMSDIKNISNEMKIKTYGGETVTFKSNPPSVNNVTIMSDYTLPNGNEIFIISEVLFVSEAVVSRLHQMHKDKETPPLLAFPWFGAQFLSHAFLALERDTRFTQITRFLNTAEIAPFISGSNYTFFVPFDEAFEKYSLDLLPDEKLSSEKGVKMLLNHFIKGRLYDRDLQDGQVFQTVGGNTIKINRTMPGKVLVNKAQIVESEIFVYNLGTMFYIDDVLYPELLQNDVNIATESFESKESESTENTTEDMLTNERNEIATKKPTTSIPRTQLSSLLTTQADVEIVPSEFTESTGNEKDFLLHDYEFVTPNALPLKFNINPPKK